jgi:Transposase domain (DUF772)
MRGSDRRSGALFSYVNLEKRVPSGHPLRVIRGIANDALVSMSDAFGALYASTGRPSIPPEMLLRALLLQAFYGVRSERQLMERLEFDLLFRWFVGLEIDGEADQDDPVDRFPAERLGRFDFLEEPRPAARGRCGGSLPRRHRCASKSAAAGLDRAFLRRRHADRGLGVDEELQAEDRGRGAAR